jgi:hypothetical protein
MELLYPNGFWFLRKHQYARYLHILTKKEGNENDPQPWQGITGRVKQLAENETKRLMTKFKEIEMTQTKMQTKLESVEEKMQTKLESVEENIDGELANIKQLLSQLT